jgi:RNA polymerase sigma-70 factor (family 1)
LLPASTYSDQHLVEALNKGSEKAFDALFNRYWYKAYQAAYGKVKSKEIAEEIVQDIFMSLWDKRGTLTITNFSNYVKAAIKYQAVDFIRSKLVQQKYWNYYKAYIPQTDNSTEKKVAFNELMDTIEEGMVKIPEKSLRIFYLNRLEGKSVKEIANTLRLSEKAIEYHLTKSLKELKLHLKDFIFFIILLFS